MCGPCQPAKRCLKPGWVWWSRLSRSLHVDGVRDRRQGRRARLPSRLRRRCRGGCARPRGRGRHRQVDVVARRGRVRAHPWAASAVVATFGARTWVRRTSALAISSSRSSTRCCSTSLLHAGARSRLRCSARGRRTSLSQPHGRGCSSRRARAAERAPAHARCDRRRPVARLGVVTRVGIRPAAAGLERRLTVLLAKRLGDGDAADRARTSARGRRIERVVVGPLECGRASSVPPRSTRERRFHGRRCSASTSDRAGTRSSRSSSRAFFPRTSNRCSRFRSRRRSTSSCGARLDGASRRDAEGARGRGSPRARRRSRCSSRRASPRSRSSPPSRPGSSNATDPHPLHASAAVVRPLRRPRPRAASHPRADRRDRRRSDRSRPAPRAGHRRARRRRRAVLDEAAALADERGAGAVTSELAEQALRLTPPVTRDERHRAGVGGRARPPGGRRVDARTVDRRRPARRGRRGPLRAETLLLLADFEHDDLAVPVLEEALGHAAVGPTAPGADRHPPRLGPALQEWIRRCARRGALPRSSSPKPPATTRCATRRSSASPCSEASSATPKRRRLQLAHASSRLRAATSRMIRHAERLNSGWFTPAGAIDAERAKLERVYREWHERDELFAASVIWDLAWIELWAGRWAIASDYAERAREIRLQYGVDQNQSYIPIAWIAAYRRRPRPGGATGGARAEAVRGADRFPPAPPPGRAGNRRALAGRCGRGRRAPRRRGQPGSRARVARA